jgi:predicted proteasome-type protease
MHHILIFLPVFQYDTILVSKAFQIPEDDIYVAEIRIEYESQARWFIRSRVLEEWRCNNQLVEACKDSNSHCTRGATPSSHA